MAKSTRKAAGGMVAHLINFKPDEWQAAEGAAKSLGSDNVSSFVREAVREKVARERKARKP